MINLLPPERASQIKYGRRNAALRRWLIFVLLAIAGLVIIIAAGALYINGQSNNLNHQVADFQSRLQNQNLQQVKKDAAEISGDIKVINQVLSREIRFSALMQEVGKVMPRGTVLESLTLNKVTGALDLSASATDYTSAAQIAINLNDPKNGLFDKVDIININCGNVNDSAYKCTASLRALFNKTAQSRFLSVAKDTK